MGGGGPPTKTKLFSIGHPQKQNYFPLATHKNKTIFRWPMAKTKLFPIGPWLSYDHENPLAGGSGRASAPPGRPKVTAPGGNLGVALRSKLPTTVRPKNKTIFHWPPTKQNHWSMAKTKLFPIGQWLFYDPPGRPFKNKTTFRWPLAKTKLFSVGPWQTQNYFPIQFLFFFFTSFTSLDQD